MKRYVCPRCGLQWQEESKNKNPECIRCHEYGTEVDDEGRVKETTKQ